MSNRKNAYKLMGKEVGTLIWSDNKGEWRIDGIVRTSNFHLTTWMKFTAHKESNLKAALDPFPKTTYMVSVFKADLSATSRLLKTILVYAVASSNAGYA